MPLCGPKLSMLCTVVSAWGLVQLGLTGVAFFVRSPALVEDIPIHELLHSFE
uniref:Ribonuclease kappa n=1 Tax=Paracalanus parvus TaxID=187406 RepID=A0A0U2V3K6_9MAXI|nr:ribonuclease kappa [Paracalanus parvus]